MLIVRNAFQARYGRGDELVALFQEIVGHWAKGEHTVAPRALRILTDASGPFFTVVTEMEAGKFSAYDLPVLLRLAQRNVAARPGSASMGRTVIRAARAYACFPG